MNPPSKESKSEDVANYLAVAFAAASLVAFRDFANDHAIRHALGGIGFSLAAYGTFTNGFVTEMRNLGGRYASFVGAACLLASAVIATAPAASALVSALG